jgi:hypothetical protein
MGGFPRDTCIRTACIILVLVAVAFAMVWARAFYGSMQAYQQGEACLEKDQYIRAVTFFDRSIRWYTPLNPYVRKSAERLWEIGMLAKQQDDIRLALIAMRTIRRGFYAAGSVYTPGKDWIKRCNVQISRLMEIDQSYRETEGGSGALDKSTPGSLEATSPSTPWSIIVEIGFLGWIGSVVGFIMFACKDSGEARLFARPALVWGCLSLIFFALWIVAMMRA